MGNLVVVNFGYDIDLFECINIKCNQKEWLAVEELDPRQDVICPVCGSNMK